MQWWKVYDFQLHGPEPQAIGTVRTIDLDGKRLCLARTAEGYFAIDDKCPHAGASLGRGKCNEAGLVVCPVHRFEYDPKTGKGTHGDCTMAYATKTEKDGVYIGIESGRPWWKLW